MGYKLGTKDIPRFKTLGSRIAWWRTERKLERRDLAKRVGMPYSTLSEIENEGQHSSTKIASLAAVLQVNAYYLETDEGDPLDIKAVPALAQAENWPFSFPKSVLGEFDENELELAEMKYLQSLEQIRKKRRKSTKRSA
jgi:transcriptional regulator with XRE-family HTH domain